MVHLAHMRSPMPIRTHTQFLFLFLQLVNSPVLSLDSKLCSGCQCVFASDVLQCAGIDAHERSLKKKRARR